MQKHRVLSPSRGLAFVALLATSSLQACCPPNCSTGTVYPPAPTSVVAWNDNAMKGNYEALIDATTKIIYAGQATPGYVDAFLYRGVAKLALGDSKGAQEDLGFALGQKDQFAPEYIQQEQMLLYRGLMIASESQGEPQVAKTYLGEAINLAKTQAEKQDIQQEFDNRTLVIKQLTP